MTTADPFATLGIERSFDVELVALEKRHRELSRAMHPDRHAAGGATERRLALNSAIEVNEAWRKVKDPIRRAEELFRLAGVAVGEANEPKASPALLMDMMEQREALGEARASGDAAAMSRLAAEVEGRANATLAALGAGFREAKGDAAALRALVPRLGELRFFRRLLDEVGEARHLAAEALAGAGAARV